MGEIFLRNLSLDAIRDGGWLTVCIDLKGGLDLSNLDVPSVRLNGCVSVAADEIRNDVLYLSFHMRDVRAFVAQSLPLTLTGRFSDGLGIRGSVRLDRVCNTSRSLCG